MSQSLKKILFVDDDLDILTIAKYSLEKLSDIESKYLNSGEETIREALIFKPDLVIINILMPRLDGISTVQTMRLIPALKEIPVILITARDQTEELTDYKKLGILDIIKKPFDPLQLGELILNIWNKHQLKND